MNSILPYIMGAVVLAAAGGVVWFTFRASRPTPARDDYLHALEHWIDGELDEAATLLRQVVRDNPESVEAFLQLGNLLRIQGDPNKAAVLHRGLTVRPDLTHAQKVLVGISLAEDLNALESWKASREVLDTLGRNAFHRSRYWKARFTMWHGSGKAPEAARTLRDAPRYCPERDQDWFLQAYAGYQLDRALDHAIQGQSGEVNARLKDVRDIPGTQARVALVQAILAVVQDEAAKAVTVASESLLDHPQELAIFLPILQEVLLGAGQFARTVPILERSCQSDNAPPALWIDLALLYEKVGERDRALRFLESKAGSPQFTPNAAAPFLRKLMADVPGSDVARVWKTLSMPAAVRGWTCKACRRTDERVRWFCPSCLGFNTYRAGTAKPGRNPR